MLQSTSTDSLPSITPYTAISACLKEHILIIASAYHNILHPVIPSWISLAFFGSKHNSSQRFWRKAALLSVDSKMPPDTDCASRLRYTFEVTSSIMASVSRLPKPNIFFN